MIQPHTPERDFEMFTRRFCYRLRNTEDPKVRELVDQGLDLLKRKGTGSVLRDAT